MKEDAEQHQEVIDQFLREDDDYWVDDIRNVRPKPLRSRVTATSLRWIPLGSRSYDWGI